MGVHLREKKVKSGQISFYLDIYHNKRRWYEFLDIHINKNKPTEDDREKKRLANEIKVKRENELTVLDNGLIDRSKRKADYVAWFEGYMKEMNLNNNHNTQTLIKLKNYLNGQSLPFTAITPVWIKAFTKHLLSIVSHNSASLFLSNISSSLSQAVIQEIIMQNPFSKIPKNERLRQKDTFRNSFTMDELQVLWDTPNKKQQYKLAFLFGCFTGLRWSDVNPLRWSEIITKTIDGKQEWFIYFEQEKTEDIEYLPLSEQAVIILQERKQTQMLKGEHSLYVFPMVKEIDQKKQIVYKRVRSNLKIWAKNAGFDSKRMHFHSSRHTFATNILENSPDADLWTVSKLLGHKSISATQKYAHVRDSRKKSAVKALPTLNIKHAAA